MAPWPRGPKLDSGRRWPIAYARQALEDALVLVDAYDRAYELAEPYERRLLNRAFFDHVWVTPGDEALTTLD